ncbi:MAG: ATP-binding protein [Pseudomonadota bacterium]
MERRPSRSESGVDYGLLIGNLPSAVLCVDQDYRVLSVNPAAEQLFSASWNTLAQKTLEHWLAPHSTLIALMEQVAHVGITISEYGVQLALSRGVEIEVDVHICPLVEQPGSILISLHPCSMARGLDQQRAHRGSTRSVAALARILAHEVKNPLSGIRGAAQLLEPYVDNEDKALVQLIYDETDRICDLVDRMEEFTETGSLNRKSINIHQVLEHVRRVSEAGFARHVRFLEAYDPSLPMVDGDRDRLVQLFLNLVKNAAEAVPKSSGQIGITTHYQHGFRVTLNNSDERLELPITVEVRDNGPGVPDDMIENMFDPFVTTKPKGGGLGLSLVAKIVNDHQGVVSYHRGTQGSIFRVRLPSAPSLKGSPGVPT